MNKIRSKQDIHRVRKLALMSQGLLPQRAFGQGKAGAVKAVEHLSYIQLDSISVIQRAHHHVLSSRVPKYQPDMANQLLKEGSIFEYWSHAAAFLPIKDYRFSLPYKQALKQGKVHWYKNPDRQLMAELLERVREQGPLRSRDLEQGDKKREGWWDWKPAKRALEQLYMEGDLMVCDREGFQKNYDLTERVLPKNINRELPSLQEFAQHLLAQQLRCHGLITAKGVTYLRKNSALRNTVKALITKGIAAGELEAVQLVTGDKFIIRSGALEQNLPRYNQRLLILSPFDNLLIQRDRLKALFNFDYQLECYVPEAKRRFGYLSLPLLYQGEFIGQMDCKAHRKTRVLEIKSLHWLDEYQCDLTVIEAFVEAVKGFMAFQQCDRIKLTQTNSQPLTAVLNSLF